MDACVNVSRWRSVLGEAVANADEAARRSFLADWDAEDGPVSNRDIDKMAERYDL